MKKIIFLFVFLIGTACSYAQDTNKIIIMKIYESTVTVTFDLGIKIYGPDSTVERIEFDRVKINGKEEEGNILVIKTAIDKIIAKGYELKTSTQMLLGAVYITTHIFQKKLV